MTGQSAQKLDFAGLGSSKATCGSSQARAKSRIPHILILINATTSETEEAIFLGQIWTCGKVVRNLI